MTKCEQCGYIGSDWCMSCTVVTPLEHRQALEHITGIYMDHCQCGMAIDSDWLYCPMCAQPLRIQPPRVLASPKSLSASEPLLAPRRGPGPLWVGVEA